MTVALVTLLFPWLGSTVAADYSGSQMIASITGEKFEDSALPAPAQANREDISAIARETIKSSTSLNGFTLAWWIPYEYWQVAIKQFTENQKMPPSQIAQIEEMMKPLSYYTIIAAIVSKGDLGKFTYASGPEIRSYIQLLDSDGNAYRPLDEKTIKPETQSLLLTIKPILIKAMSELGPFGENINVFLFSSTGKSGRRIADAKSDGTFSVQMDKISFKWRTPVGSMLPLKRCPVDGEEVNGGWKFCPWHGAKLPENK